jgi:hypothetical protein
MHGRWRCFGDSEERTIKGDFRIVSAKGARGADEFFDLREFAIWSLGH